MEIVDKANVIADLYAEFESALPPEVDAVFQMHDCGLPYALGIAFGHIAALTSEGESQVNDLWNSLLLVYDMDDIEYDLNSFILAAGLVSDNFIFSNYEITNN